MAVNYQIVNLLKNTADVEVEASSTEAVVIPRIELSQQDSLHFRLRLVCSAAVEDAGISWKLQHSWDGSNWEDVDRGGSEATVSVYGIEAADGDVTTANDTVDEAAHEFETGDAVYYKSSAGNVITGLTDDTVYYVIDNAAGNFQLATTYENAIAGTAIALTQPSGGDTHFFTRITSELRLSIDNSSDEPLLPLLPLVRVVATTGSGDTFNVSDAWFARRV